MVLARLDRGCVLLIVGLGLWATPAAAHIELLSPAARYSPDTQKAPPCGRADNPPGAGPVAVYQPGETITVEFDEFVNHAGHFRIALDPSGTDAFVSPTGFDDFYNSPEVLLDDIPDMAGGTYSIEVTLPDAPCDPCTLQLIQVMNDGNWGPGNSDLYFQCADIVIEGAAGDVGSGTSGPSGTGGNDSTGGAGSTSSGAESGAASSEGGGGSEGTTEVTGGSASESTGPADSSDGGGCSCRAEGGAPLVGPWLLLGLLAVRRRRG